MAQDFGGFGEVRLADGGFLGGRRDRRGHRLDFVGGLLRPGLEFGALGVVAIGPLGGDPLVVGEDTLLEGGDVLGMLGLRFGAGGGFLVDTGGGCRSWRRGAGKGFLPGDKGFTVDGVEAGVCEGSALLARFGVVGFDGLGAGEPKSVAAAAGFDVHVGFVFWGKGLGKLVADLPRFEDVPDRIGIRGIADGDDGVAVSAQIGDRLVPLNYEAIASGGICAEGRYAAKNDCAVVVASAFVGGVAGNLDPVADELRPEGMERRSDHREWRVRR